MDFNYSASVYLTRISTAVLSLSNMTGCISEPEKLRKALITMLELEQTTADFISEMEFSVAGVKVCKNSFIHANETAIGHLQKIQSQGSDFSEYITALKLETETLKKELASL